MPAPATQALLLTTGLLPLLVYWDQRNHGIALVWAIALTVCCWRISPGWAALAMLAATTIAAILWARSFTNRHGRAQQRAVRAHEIELLALRARREQWTTIAVLPVRLRAYTELARLLASEQDRSLPPPPAEPRPGPSELWERLDGAYRVASAAAVTTTAGLAKRGARRCAYDRLTAAAGELAERIERECEQLGQTAGEDSRVLPARSGEPARWDDELPSTYWPCCWPRR